MPSFALKPRLYRIPCRAIFLALVLVLMAAAPAFAERSITPPPNVTLDVGQEKLKPMWVAVPYAFKSETTDWAYGAAFGMRGYLQEQAGLAGAVLSSSNGSAGGYLVGWNYKVPYAKRLFFDFTASMGKYGNDRFYVNGNPGFPASRAGSNSSDASDYISAEGIENWADITFRYVMPLGSAKNSPMSRYVTKNGLLTSGATGGKVWNPLSSGISLLEIKPFYRKRTLELSGQDMTRESAGFMAALSYNNTDFPVNPSRGSVQRLALRRDVGMLSDSEPWTTVEAEIAGYWDLGKWPGLKQSVLAVDFWTIDTPTWSENDGSITGQPPTYFGGSLGGFWRMRGFPSNRFNDRSAIYYAAELRMIPKWQPLSQDNTSIAKWLKFFKIDWWQFVTFAEAGRVAPVWSLDELHTDMKWDLGCGIRFLALKSVARVDFAYSEEGMGIWAMVGHPF